MYEEPRLEVVGKVADVVMAIGLPEVPDEDTFPDDGQPSGFVAGLDS